MKDFDKVYAESVAKEYAPQTDSKVVALRKLDRKVKRPVEIFTYVFGVVFTLVLGVGMCFAMGVLGDGDMIMMVIGSIIGIIGIVGVSINYPIYKKILNHRKAQYANDIIDLAKSISE